MVNTNKMDVSTVYEMFEEINSKLNKHTNVPTEPAQVDMTTVNNLAEKLENVMEGVKKPAKVEHHHRHTIDIRSSKVFLSLTIMALTILGLSYFIGEQRKSIGQYKENDLKYRYIKMQGQISEKNLYRLEEQFQYGDSIKIIRRQVEEYEKSVKE
ncbi:MAG: hypothetical protein LBE91_05860 [Tannerella sp.]|jgi:hypothetical protein|nr:hypothetical protein [Tannerella sp.]